MIYRFGDSYCYLYESLYTTGVQPRSDKNASMYLGQYLL